MRQSDPPWMHNELRKFRRRLKRAYDKAKRTNNTQHWENLKKKKMRSETTNLLRSSKKSYFDNLANEPRHDKTNNVAVRPAKTQISLGIRPVSDQSLRCALNG